MFFAAALVVAAIALCVYLLLKPAPSSSPFFCGRPNPPTAVIGYPDGRALFNANCASCHKMDMNLTGPALEGVRERWHNDKLLREHIMNAKSVRKKSAYAKQLWLAYNKMECPNFTGVLTGKDIEAIMLYARMVVTEGSY